MNLYQPGQRVSARVTWEDVTRLRNCRLVAQTSPGIWTVNVWSNMTHTFYTNEIEIEEADIAAITPLSSI